MSWFASYASGLAVMLFVITVTLLRRPGEVITIGRTMLVILLNWVAGVAWVKASGDYTPWAFNILIDSAAATAIMWKPAGRAQGYIGLFYMLQITAHIAFGMRTIFDIRTDAIFYYHAITYVAWAQLAALGVWAGGVWMGDLLHRVRSLGPARLGRAGARDLRDPAK